ncbi:MAG: GTPase ObgE, partial [Candidatus Binatia bacterium]
GGPNGGNGGNGGHVVVMADPQLNTLLDLSYQKHYRAARGEHGRGKDQHGKNGEDMIITVPVGTVIRDARTEEILMDLKNPDDRFVVATGGKGGKGNAFFTSSTNRSPRRVQPGLPGEERDLHLELRLLADVGLVGFPNVGKSTLIAAISAARPKIADYPFTTLVPNLGVVSYGEAKSFVLADIPGLIEGAHAGEGLGDRFLKHVSRTSLLVHILDASNIREDEPVADYVAVYRELELFDPSLVQKPHIVVANKIDLLGERRRLKLLEEFCHRKQIPFLAISAVTGEGLRELKWLIGARMEKAKISEGETRVATWL